MSLILFPSICLSTDTHTHTNTQLTMSLLRSHVRGGRRALNHFLFIFYWSISIWELKSCFSSVYHKEAHDTSRPWSLEALLCTCISCNYNLTGKHIHSHSFRVPEQNNKLVAITHICGSAWLKPCCTVSGPRGGHFPRASTSALIHSKWPLYGFTLDCTAVISQLPCQCLSVNCVKLFQLKSRKKPSPLIKSNSPTLNCDPSPPLSSPPASLTLAGSPGLAWAGCAEVERLAG